MDSELDFTEDEIREQLVQLGYQDVSHDRLREFKRDLEELVKHEHSKNSSLFSTSDESSVGSNEQHYRGASNRPHEERTYAGASAKVDNVRYGKDNFYNPAAPPQKNQTKDPISIHQPQIHMDTGAVTTNAASVPEPSSSSQQQDFVPHFELPQQHSEFHQPVQSKFDHPDDSMNTTTSSDKKVVKRKTMRKTGNGNLEIYETESEAGDDDDVNSLQERLRALPIHVSYQRPSTAPVHGRAAEWHHYSRPHTARDQPVYRLPEGFDGLKALIHPMKKQPNTQNVKKMDPVTRYQQYATSWGQQKAPGEKNHKGLRWSTREHMLYHDEVVQKKQSKVFVPNNYIVPSDKKRKNLRWQIRNDLATGVKPPSMFD